MHFGGKLLGFKKKKKNTPPYLLLLAQLQEVLSLFHATESCQDMKQFL